MRRNMGRRSNNNNNSGGSSGGPLMTGHLQDIELQLELLKRKREMIEQQQELLVMEQQYKTSASRYDQMRYDEPDQHGSNRDYSHLYETGPNYRSQFGRKRQAENQWQYDNAPKRIPPKKKNLNQSQINQQGLGNTGSGNFRNPRPNQSQGQNQGSKFAPRQPAPLMEVKLPKQSIAQKIASQKAQPKTRNKDFTPSKVSKPKAPAAPNKMASNTVAERKSLVAAAIESSSDDVSRMLLPDRVPSQQVSGRLELALGAIMKNVKALIQAQPQHAPALRSIQLQRVMKQAVRERIRTVMLGKVVGSLLDILAIYREEFPEETDADILNIALEAGGALASDQEKKINFIESEDPGEFFRINMSRLLETKLNEMFSKLEDIYGNVTAGETAPSVEQIDFIKKGYNKFDENSKEYKEFLNSNMKVNDIKRFLPHLLKKFIPYIIKLINADENYQNTKAAVTMKANEKAAKIFGTNGSEEGQGDGNNSASETPKANRRMYNLPYYIKVLGRPSLPRRKAMQGFLSQFNPKSIKKHRTIHNLLFVGFTEKTDFDAMVGADGTVIGKSTLSVRVCSKDGPRESNGESSENNDTSLSNDISKTELKHEVKNEEDIIPSDLDCQITDLLSSIRKSEEEDTIKKENGEKLETDNNGGDGNTQSVTEQPENNFEQAKTEQTEEKEGDVQNDEETEGDVQNDEETEGDVQNDEEMNAATEENVDEIVTKENLEDNNTTSQDENTQKSEPANDSEKQNTETADEANTKNPEVSNDTENPKETEISNDSNKEQDSQNTNGEETQLDTNPTDTAPAKPEEHSADKVGELKSSGSGRSTPSRMSARLANVTPSTIRTRRASKLASQN